MSKWSEDDVTTLCRMWAEGATTRLIAQKVGATRNAVVGKAHRIGLGEHKRPPRPSRSPRSPRPTPHPSPPKEVQPPPPLPSSTVGLGVPFCDLAPQQCRWIPGEPAYDAPACGLPIAHKMYCAKHAQEAFDRRPRRSGRRTNWDYR